MTAAIIGLSVAVAALTVALAMSAAQGRRLIGELVAAGKREIAEQSERRLAEQKAREMDFELRQVRAALAAANVRAKLIEEELSHAGTRLGDGLAAADVVGRVRRIAEQWRRTQAAGSPLPAESSQAVHQPAAAAGAEPADVHAHAHIDVLR